jgi:hypothetical protein
VHEPVQEVGLARRKSIRESLISCNSSANVGRISAPLLKGEQATLDVQVNKNAKELDPIIHRSQFVDRGAVFHEVHYT